jgi:ribose transport system permease protein
MRDGAEGAMARRTRLGDWVLRLQRRSGLIGAIALFAGMYLAYQAGHPRGFTSQVFIQNANEGMALALIAMAQTVPVLMAGLDLSVGAVMTLVACLASHLLTGSPAVILSGTVACVATGAFCGFVNGCVVVYGRIQPIIATLATGAIFLGIALFLRPTPGGKVDSDLSWAMTSDVAEFAATFDLGDPAAHPWLWPLASVPIPLLLLLAIVLLVWVPFTKTVTGRTIYAIGSGEGAAYMSGLPIDRAKLAAFTMAGLLSGLAGLFIALQTSSGNADIPQAGAYTLNSIAAVVIGGTSLAGGRGNVRGALIGAFVIGFLADGLVILGVSTFWQTVIKGAVIVLAVILDQGQQRVQRRGAAVAAAEATHAPPKASPSAA